MNTTTTTRDDWLRSLCKPDAHYEDLRHPWTHAGWTGASDGKGMVFFTGEQGYPGLEADVIADVVADALKQCQRTGGIKYDRDELRAWAGEYDPECEETCPKCDGDYEERGDCTYCRGTGEVYCEECDRAGARCPECDGTGDGWCEECDEGKVTVGGGPRYGLLIGVGIDRNLLALVLADPEAPETLRASRYVLSDIGGVCLSSKGWGAVIASMSGEPGDAPSFLGDKEA